MLISNQTCLYLYYTKCKLRYSIPFLARLLNVATAVPIQKLALVITFLYLNKLPSDLDTTFRQDLQENQTKLEIDH